MIKYDKNMIKTERISVMESTPDDTEVPTIPLSDTDSAYSLSHLASKINPQGIKNTIGGAWDYCSISIHAPRGGSDSHNFVDTAFL